VTVERIARVTSWCLVGLAAAASLYTLFAHWAVNAESFGKRDAGWALFFSFSGAWTLVACFWLALIALGAAVAIKLTRSGPAWPVLVAAVLGVLPFLVMK
jgi:hypothetical protein